MRYLIIFSVITCFSFTAWAEQSNKVVTIAGYAIPKMIESSTEGLFVQLMREAGRNAGYEVRVDVFPAKRAVPLFQEGKYDAVMPMTGTFRPIMEGPRTHSFYVKRTFAFVREGTQIPLSIQELNSMRVGLNSQYDNAPELLGTKGINFIWGHDDTNMMKMLAAGRIDTLVIEEFSGIKALRNAGATNITYNPDYPITVTNAYTLFQNNERGKEIASRISKEIVKMKINGRFEVIMGAR